MESMAGASLLRPQGTSFPPSDGFPRRSSPSSRITSGVSSRSSPSLSFLCARCSHSPSVSVAPRSPAYSLSSRCSWAVESRKVVRGRCLLSTAQEFPEPNKAEGDGSDKVQAVLLDIFNSLLIRLGREGRQNGLDVLRILKGANSFIPHIVLGSTVLALAYPPSFTWFTTRYYAPALGFLMFAVGVNSSAKDFLEAIGRPRAIITGYIGQFIVKPFFGYLFGILSVTVFRLPTSIGAGIMLVSCVSGAQLSNYATFLTDPSMAPLSIVMTSLSTATAVFVTPALSFLLIGKKLPVDVRGMMLSITQIVVVPIALGLFLNRFLPRICAAIQPFLPPLSVIVTALCVGSPLAINVASIVSPFGMTILTLILGFHASSFVAGYLLPGIVFRNAPDMKALQRTISFETGMQSSLLALALANRFFPDPLVGVPPAISVVLMSLMGFSLVMMWSKKDT